jgi:hypothetical protein
MARGDEVVWRVRKLVRDEIADFSGPERNFRHAKIDLFLDRGCRFLTKRRILRIGIPLRMWQLSNSDAVLSGYHPKGAVVPCHGNSDRLFWRKFGSDISPRTQAASRSCHARTPPRFISRTINFFFSMIVFGNLCE